MKILKKNDGPLTNFEVLEFLRSRGATSDPLGCLGSVATSECKVFDYLIQSPACNQTKKDVDEFLKRCDTFDLAKAEKLNIINLRPSTQAEIYPRWIPYKSSYDWMTHLGTTQAKGKSLYTIKDVPLTDVHSIRRHTPSLWQYIIIVLSSAFEGSFMTYQDTSYKKPKRNLQEAHTRLLVLIKVFGESVLGARDKSLITVHCPTLVPHTLRRIRIIEYCDKRFPSNEDGDSKVEELVQLVVEVLPPPPKTEEEESNQEEAE